MKKYVFLVLCLFSSVAVNADFSCNLDQIKKNLNGELPPLILSGEDHDDKDSQFDKNLHILEASKESIFVGLEGIYEDKNLLNHSFVKGYEKPISYGFGFIFSYICARSSIDDKIKRSKDAIRVIKLNSFLFDEWKNFYLAFKSQNNAILLNMSDEAYFCVLNLLEEINLNLNLDFETITAGYESIVFSSETQLYFMAFSEVLFTRFLNHLSQIIQTKYNGSNIILDKAIQEIVFFNNPKFFCNYYKKIVVDARDLDMAKGIEKLYCEAVSLNKPLFIVTGLSHLLGLENILKSSSQNLIEISIRYSKNSYQAYHEMINLDLNVPLDKNQMLELEEVKKQFFLISNLIEIAKFRELQDLQKTLDKNAQYSCGII